MNDFINKKKKDGMEIKNRIIGRQSEEIQSLKDKISALEIDCKTKDDLIHSVDYVRNDMIAVIEDLKKQSKKYDELINELTEMKNTMNKIVFKKKWKLIRWLLK